MKKFKITDLSKGTIWTVDSTDEVYHVINSFARSVRLSNGSPAAFEVEGWAEVASIGEVFKHRKFTVEVL